MGGQAGNDAPDDDYRTRGLRLQGPDQRQRGIQCQDRGEGEEAKVAVRNLRRDANNKIAALVKEKEISEDEQRRAETEIQKLTDKYITEVDKLVAEKEKEIMTV